jgi:hypothetical protein
MTFSLLSRRDFLRLAGISLIAAQMPLPAFSTAQKSMYARAFSAVAIQSAPTVESALVRHLWPNTILEVEGIESGWYRLADGFVPVESLQPMQPFFPDGTQPVLETGMPITVSGPVAALRQWCAADAPLVTHIGHGGTAYVADYLPDIYSGWYAISDADHSLLGWSQSSFWSSMTETEIPLQANQVVVNRQTNQISVYVGDRLLLQSACSVGDLVDKGAYPLTGRQFASRQGSRYGIPYAFRADGLSMYGVYWHNRFSTNHPGTAVELPVLTAATLYNILDEKSHILVV